MTGPYYAQDYWSQGRRIGVIASSDEHSGQGGRRHGGITAVLANDLTRKDVFNAILQRRCYASTGERVLIDFMADDLCMGESGERKQGEGVKLNLNVWGTDLLLRVDILRYRFGLDTCFKPVVSKAPTPESMDMMVLFEDIIETPCMYYARITQEPLEWPVMAWTSPIWIDVEE